MIHISIMNILVAIQKFSHYLAEFFAVLRSILLKHSNTFLHSNNSPAKTTNRFWMNALNKDSSRSENKNAFDFKKTWWLEARFSQNFNKLKFYNLLHTKHLKYIIYHWYEQISENNALFMDIRADKCINDISKLFDQIYGRFWWFGIKIFSWMMFINILENI